MTTRSFEQKRVLITVRTYPVPSQRYVELSCTAGITADRQWIRLYPVVYRLLPSERRFHKWQWIDVAVKRASRGPRASILTTTHSRS